MEEGTGTVYTFFMSRERSPQPVDISKAEKC